MTQENCQLNGLIGRPKLTKSIQKRAGSDAVLFSELAAIIDSTNFKKWYESNTGKKLVTNENQEGYSGTKTIVNKALKYHGMIMRDASATVKTSYSESERRARAGFYSDADYDYAIQRTGGLFVAQAKKLRERGIKREDLATETHKVATGIIGNNVKKRIAENLVSDDKLKEIVASFTNNKNVTNWKNVLAYAVKNNFVQDEVLAKEVFNILNQEGSPVANMIAAMRKLIDADFASIQDQNLLALFDNLVHMEYYRKNNVNRFYDELHMQAGVANIFDKVAEEEDLTTEFAEDYSDTTDAQLTEETHGEKSVDNSFRQMEHSGLYKDFIKHADARAIEFLMSVPKLASADSTTDFDLNNPLGLPEMIDYKAYINGIMSHIDRSSVPAMINSLIVAGKNKPGFESFVYIAEQMQKDPALAYMLYNNFAKTVMSKLITTINETGVKSGISNKNSSRISVLTYNFMNSSRHSSPRINFELMSKNINSLAKQIENNNDLEDEELAKSRDKIVQYFTEYFKEFYSDINSSSILLFLNKNNADTVHDDYLFEDNAKILLEHLKQANEGAIETAAEFDSMMSDVRAIKKANTKERERFIEEISQAENIRSIKKPKIIDVKTAYREYMSSKSSSAAIELAKLLEPYTPIRTNLNSRDVHRHLSSDPINSSLLTNLKETLERMNKDSNGKDNVIAEKFKAFKFGGSQYDFSRLLIEQSDAKGVVNKGLFRRLSDGSYELTEYASELIKIDLFQGVDNETSNNQALYKDMSPGDFFTTGLNNYFNTEQGVGTHGITFGTYFTRINSDAPKIFTIRAPRYKVTEYQPNGDNENALFRYVDTSANNAVTIERATIVSELNKVATDEVVDDGAFTVNYYANGIDAITKLLSGETKELDLSKQLGNSVVIEMNGKHYIKVTDNNDRNVMFYLAGTFDNKTKVFSNIEFSGFYPDVKPYVREKYISKVRTVLFERDIKTGRLTRIINKDHPLFRQFRLVFNQELTDMADAIDYMFVTNIDRNNCCGGVVKSNGKVQFNHGLKNDGAGVRGLYDVYHYKDKIIKNGKLTGSVFTSDKMTVTDANGNTTNFGQIILDSGLFKILDYTEDDIANNNLLRYKKEGNKVEVVLTTQQQEFIDNQIEQFIDAYLKRGKERIEEQYSEFIDEKYKNDVAYADFLLNNHLMMISMNEFLEGDAKFYGDSTKFLKRSKEIQGSGTPLGNFNLANNWDYDFRELVGQEADGVTKLGLKYSYISPTGGQEKTVDIVGQSCFRGATIKNSKRTTVNKTELRKAMINAAKIDEVMADKLLDGFDDTKINDAQSYITVPEFIRRIVYRGDYARYKDLISKLLDPNTEWSKADIDEFVQVQKNFYYDLYKDPVTGRIVPRQIKNAEFVLVPQWIKGTELEYVNSLMMEYGIDQLNTVETSKAANHNVMTLWNDDGFLDPSDFEANASTLKENYNYNYLYVQQKTSQHMDSENKAAIQVMKKIIDNLDTAIPEVKRLQDLFNSLYEANIEESLFDLMKDLGVNVVDGKIQMIETQDAKGKTIYEFPSFDKSKLYEKLKEEAIRRGSNKNMLDYVTTDNFGNPIMPSYLGVLSTTFENLCQSIFTNTIARQKLPGFHAAQISSVGFNEFSKEKGQIKTDDALKYHPNGNGYIEVMIPKPEALSQFDDETALKMLQDADADEMIGYRIPTEGKQSIAVMKVVKFLPKGYGSTIVVPHAWVSQTGSDFDIDSIYTIWKDIKLGKNNKLVSYAGKYDGSPDPSNRYINYVLSKLTKEERKAFREANKLTEEEYKESREQVDSEIENSFYRFESDYKASAKDAIKNKLFDAVKMKAQELGLLSYDDFSEKKITEQNALIHRKYARDVRNWELCDTMISIMKHASTLEENLSRSNFEDVTAAMNLILKNTDGTDTPEAKTKKARSVFNILDQTDFQNDVVGGLKLKAFSVTRDTFNSVCNRAKTKIDDSYAIETVVSLKGMAKEEKNKYVQSLVNRFDKVVKIDDDHIKLYHTTIGWTKDNRNVVGKLLTPYSSQTTSHILDAVKEGAVKNVNDTTFAVYKTFPDVGADYNTAISFMAHPGISRLVRIYNRNRSIYSNKRNRNYVHLTIREIAEELGVKEANTRKIDEIISYLNNVYSDRIKELFDVTDNTFAISLTETDGFKIPFNSEKQLKDIYDAQSIPPVGESNQAKTDRLLRELGVVLQYNAVAKLGKVISDTARICNPDKGTKQTIYSTKKVFNDAKMILSGEDSDVLYCEDEKGAHVPFLQAIFPDINKPVNEYIMSDKESVYPVLNTFMKASTGTSISVAESVFAETQNPKFRNIVNGLQQYLAGNMTEEIDASFTKYILKNYVYAGTDVADDDINRIYGHGVNPAYTFEPKDIVNPTQDEIEAYMKLSPAQKIDWIQHYYKNGLLANYLDVNLFNSQDYSLGKGGAHKIYFKDDAIDKNIAIRLFSQMAFNNDKFITLAAYDLIKYAIHVEGLRMHRNDISSIISNDALRACGFVDQCRRNIDFLYDADPLEIKALQENFIRSHSNMSQIPLVINGKTNGKWDLASDLTFSFGILKLNAESAANHGFGTIALSEDGKPIFVPNPYVRYGNYNKPKTLHRVMIGSDGFVYIYPLMPLEENESAVYSVNDNNNEGLYPKQFYEAIITKTIANNWDLSEARTRFADLAKSSAAPEVSSAYEASFDIYNAPRGYEGSFRELRNRIEAAIREGLGQPGQKQVVYLNANIEGNAPGLFKGRSTIYIDGRYFELYRPNLKDYQAVIADIMKNKGDKTYRLNLLENNKKYQNAPDAIKFAMKNALNRQIANPSNYSVSFINGVYALREKAIETDIEEEIEDSDADSRRATIGSFSINDFSKIAVHDLNRRAFVGKNTKAKGILNRLSARGITPSNNISVKGHEKEVLAFYLNYLRDVSSAIDDLTKSYYVDEASGTEYAMNSDFVIQKAVEDEDYRRELISTILDVLAYGRTFNVLSVIQLKTDEADIKPFIDEMSSLYDTILKNPIVADTFKKLLKDYVAKNSNNTLIKEGIIDVDNPYNTMSALESWVTSYQEAGVPLIQILDKEVTNNIKAADMAAQRDARAVKKDLLEIKNRAKESHFSIDMSKVITSNGRLHREYNNTLETENTRLKLAIRKKQGTDIPTTIERLRLENEYSKFLSRHFERPLKKEYYKTMQRLNDTMLSVDDSPVTPQFFAIYKNMIDERNSIMSHADANGRLDDLYKEKLKEINAKIDDFLSPYDSEGNPKDGGDPDAETARALVRSYVSSVAKINDIYYTRKPKIGAEKLMQKYQDLVDRLEQRDSTGKIHADEVQLRNNPEYVEAVEWLNNNTVVVYDSTREDELNDAFEKLRKRTRYNNVLKRLKLLHPEILDSYGEIDGRKVDTKFLKAIKDNMQTRYNSHGTFADTRLISNASASNKIWKSDFYNQMTTNGSKSGEYLACVNAINNILRRVYDNKRKAVETWRLTKDELRELNDLYEKLDGIKPKRGTTYSSALKVMKFIENNVNFVTNEEEYKNQEALAKANPDMEWKDLWYKVNGLSVDTANSHLYSYAEPIPSQQAKYLDVEMTSAVNTINSYLETTTTQYYDSTFLEMKRKGDAEFNAWYEANHVYNPNTHKMEPLPIWTRSRAIGTNFLDSKRMLRGNMMVREIDEEYKNGNFKDDVPLMCNYIKGSDGGKYDNPITLNKYEQETKEYLEKLFFRNAKNDKARKYIYDGYVPMMHKPKPKTIAWGLKEAAKSVGMYSEQVNNDWNDDIDWGIDYEPTMPMLEKLGSKRLKQFPRREDYKTQKEYEKAFDDAVGENKNIIEENEQYIKDNIYTNWEEVISNFIIQAGHYNAVQDNKHILYFGLEALRRTPTVKTRFGRGMIRNSWLSEEEAPIHHKEVNNNAAALQETIIRRIVYNQFKEDNGGWTRFGNTLQALSSAKYMMGNITGGIANVTYGDTQIAMETFAGQYYSHADYWTARAFYTRGIAGYLAGIGQEKAYGLQDGLCKFMNVIEFDRIVGLAQADKANASIELMRNLGYSPQTSGEHMMQNTVMFAMMNSHRIYEDPTTGKYKVGSLEDYIGDIEERALMQVIEHDADLISKYEEMKKSLKTDERMARDVATYRKFLQHQFMLNYVTDSNKRKEFIKARKDIKKRAKDEFDKHEKLIDQFALDDDGFICWKKDSKFSAIADADANKICAEFADKVISVNQKIHGVYDKLGGARLEQKWYGGIVMQYHKHLYPGIMKRFRRNGYYNEQRGTVEKGNFWTLWDFLSIPFDKYQNNIEEARKAGLSAGDIQRLKGVQNYAKEVVNFVSSFSLQYEMLPETEKANIRRMLGDLAGVGAALFLSLLLYLADDDDQDTVVWNLAVYEMDRLASESALYGLYGLAPQAVFSEAKKLYSSPVAVQGSFVDLYESVEVLTGILFDEEYDPTYSSGMYAGENKLLVRLKRNIPIYRNIEMIKRLEKNNSYYKLGTNAIGMFNVKGWAERIKE